MELTFNTEYANYRQDMLEDIRFEKYRLDVTDLLNICASSQAGRFSGCQADKHAHTNFKFYILNLVLGQET